MNTITLNNGEVWTLKADGHLYNDSDRIAADMFAQYGASVNARYTEQVSYNRFAFGEGQQS